MRHLERGAQPTTGGQCQSLPLAVQQENRKGVPSNGLCYALKRVVEDLLGLDEAGHSLCDERCRTQLSVLLLNLPGALRDDPFQAPVQFVDLFNRRSQAHPHLLHVGCKVSNLSPFLNGDLAGQIALGHAASRA